jgi:hypothetical protein
MRYIYVEAFLGHNDLIVIVFHPRTLCDHMSFASLVYNTGAHLTLIALCIENTPYEITTYGTKCWLPEISGHEFMTEYLMHFATHRNTTPIERLSILFKCFFDYITNRLL